MPKCKFRSYLLHQRQAFIAHRLWITVGPGIYRTPSVDYIRAGYISHTVWLTVGPDIYCTPSVDYTSARHLLHTVCGLQ